MSRTKNKCRWVHFDLICLKDKTNDCYIFCQDRRDAIRAYNSSEETVNETKKRIDNTEERVIK